MDHKQLATPSGRRKGVLLPQLEQLLAHRAASEDASKSDCLSLRIRVQDFPSEAYRNNPSAHLFSRIGFVFASFGTTTFARPFLWLDRAKHIHSSCSRDRPTLMLSRPQAAENDTRQGFSETVVRFNKIFAASTRRAEE